MQFDPTKLGSLFRFNDGSVVTGAGAAGQIVGYNPYRVAIVIALVTGTGTVRPVGVASGTLGFPLNNTTNTIVMSLSSHGALIQQAFSGFAASGFTVYFVETLWQPPAME